MIGKKEIELFHKAIETYGKNAQIDVAIEEMSELIKALLKYRRNANDQTRKNVVEESIDVLIMINQLSLMFNFNDLEVSGFEILKINRLRDRLEAEQEKEAVKTVRFEIFQEIDIDVDPTLNDQELDKYIDGWVWENYPQFFRGDYEVIEEEELSEHAKNVLEQYKNKELNNGSN